MREGKSLPVGKLPGFIFYPGDWMKDPELRSVSSEARGLWIDMLCLMFESQPRGYLLLRGGKSVTAASLSRMTGNLEPKVIQWIEELDDKGVFSRDDQGIIFCRKMVRDQEVREQTKDRMRKYRVRNISVTSPSPVNETVNVNEDLDVGVDLKKEKESPKKRVKRPLIPYPEDFRPTEGHYHLARENAVDCDLEWVRMKDWALGRDEHKADWDAAFRNWLRNQNYRGKVNGGGTGKSKQVQLAEHNARAIIGAFSGQNVDAGLPDEGQAGSRGRSTVLEGSIARKFTAGN